MKKHIIHLESKTYFNHSMCIIYNLQQNMELSWNVIAGVTQVLHGAEGEYILVSQQVYYKVEWDSLACSLPAYHTVWVVFLPHAKKMHLRFDGQSFSLHTQERHFK